MLRSGLFRKGLSLLVVLIALAIGLRMIERVIQDREAQRSYATESVRQSTAGAQVITGPVLSRSCVEQITYAEKNKPITYTNGATVHQRAFPAQMIWAGGIDVETRRRSIYGVQTYRAVLVGDATWSAELGVFSEPKSTLTDRFICTAPNVQLLVSDQRGIRSVDVVVDGQKLTPQSGSGIDGAPAGLAASVVSMSNLPRLPKTLSAKITLDVIGMESLAIVPIAQDNQLRLNSTWAHPSFVGSYLPRESAISDSGFSASWRVSSLATEAQKRFPCGSDRSQLNGNCVQAMAVNLVDPVNPAALSERAVKYGELFIALTFVGIGLFELLRRVKVHPVQYLLIGAALAVFFLLLLSVSEHVPFALAYLLAALGCTALIAVYAKSVLGGFAAAIPLTLGCATLYGVLYLVLQSEQHALLAGSLLIFAVLAAVMLATRHIRWGAVESDPS